MREVITAEQFLKLDKKVQDVFREWWKPQIYDLFFRDFGNNQNAYMKGVYNGCIMDYEVKNNAITNKSFLPLFTEGQLRKFIDEKTGGIVSIHYRPTQSWEIIADDTYITDTDNLLQAYWQVACKIAKSKSMISKADLDKRICDVEEGTTNEQTYRDFIRESEVEFEIVHVPIDHMDDEELNDYLEYLDELWNK